MKTRFAKGRNKHQNQENSCKLNHTLQTKMRDVRRLRHASRTVCVQCACLSTCLHHSILSCATISHSWEMSALWFGSILGLHLAIQNSHLRTCKCLLCPCLPLPNLSSCCLSQADPLQTTISFAGLLSFIRATCPAHQNRLCESLWVHVSILAVVRQWWTSW